MKQCVHYKEFKPLAEFAYSNKLLKTRQKHCRACMKKFNRQSYLRRSKKKKEQAREYNQKRIKVAQQYIWDYLSNHPCVDCGESNPVVLEFDHVHGKKDIAVSDMGRHGYSIKRINKEIAKCEVRCANCHRIKTAEERGWLAKLRKKKK